MLGRLHLPIASLSILNMIRVIVLLFFFLLATSHVSSNTTDGGSGSSQAQCIEKERQALLTFKQGLVDFDNILSSWRSSRRDCCTWKGIKCDN